MTTTTTIAIPRRLLLRGALGGAAVHVGLPLLEAMTGAGRAARAAGTAPRRFGLFFWGNGVTGRGLERWVPPAEGTAFPLSPALAPLANVKDYLTVVTGMNCPQGGFVHFGGFMCILTGTATGIPSSPNYGPSPLSSVDQLAADHWNGQTRFRSLDVACSYDNTGVGNSKTSTRSGAMVPTEASPGKVFDRLFGGGTVPTGSGATPSVSPEKVKAARQSVLDAVRSDATRLGQRVGAGDRQRLGEHLEGIRLIEKRLQEAPAVATAGCAKPVRPTTELGGDRNNLAIGATCRAHADLIALALACDLTRVFGVTFNHVQGDAAFWEAGARMGHHDISHGRAGAASNDLMHATAVFTMKNLAYLAEKLKATPEGGGNLLDSICLYGTAENSESFSHSTRNMPIVILGRAGGGLRGGLHYRSKTGESTNKVLLSMLHAVGVPRKEIGLGSTLTSQSLPDILA